MLTPLTILSLDQGKLWREPTSQRRLGILTRIRAAAAWLRRRCGVARRPALSAPRRAAS